MDGASAAAPVGEGQLVLGAGELRHKVTLENPTSTADGDGGYSTTWAELTQTWAQIRPATAREIERVFAGTVSSVATHVVTVRYVDGVTTATRVVFQSRILAVTGVANSEERNRELVLACQERES